LGVVFFGGWGRGDVAVVVEMAGELREGAVGGVEFDQAGEAAARGFAELFEFALVGEAAAEAGGEGVGGGVQRGRLGEGERGRILWGYWRCKVFRGLGLGRIGGRGVSTTNRS
jgi:hypothetical protein